MKAEDVQDGRGAGPVEEEAGTGAENGFTGLAWGVGEGEAGRKVVGIAEDVLPVVADPGGHRQIGAELPFVLEETADGFFDKDDSGVAALEQDGEGSVGGEVGEGGVG